MSYSITTNKIILAQKKKTKQKANKQKQTTLQHFKHRAYHCSLSLNGKYGQPRCFDNKMYVSILTPHQLKQKKYEGEEKMYINRVH